MQISLFEQRVQHLVDDCTGPIIYYSDVLSSTLASTWFTQLRDSAVWYSGTRMMYERIVDVPRLHCHYDLNDPVLPKSLHAALNVVKQYVDAPFNSVGLNYYRDEQDSVAPHNDKLHKLIPHQPIVLLSLGATRVMVIRRKQPPHLKIELELEAGSMLLMGWNSQLHYDHGIPKLRWSVGPRISVAFRVRPNEL